MPTSPATQNPVRDDLRNAYNDGMEMQRVRSACVLSRLLCTHEDADNLAKVVAEVTGMSVDCIKSQMASDAILAKLDN